MKSAVLCVGIIGVCAGSSDVALAIRVPASEVPNPCEWIGDPDCSYERYYERYDSAVNESQGSGFKVFASGTVDCNNCNTRTATMNCSKTDVASFTETLSLSVSPGISGKVGIELELKGSIGSINGHSVGARFTCGGSIPPCTWTQFKGFQTVEKNKRASITHSYKCYSKTTDGPNPPCVRTTLEQDGGSKESSGHGDKGSESSGGCEAIGDKKCP